MATVWAPSGRRLVQRMAAVVQCVAAAWAPSGRWWAFVGGWPETGGVQEALRFATASSEAFVPLRVQLQLAFEGAACVAARTLSPWLSALCSGLPEA